MKTTIPGLGFLTFVVVLCAPFSRAAIQASASSATAGSPVTFTAGTTGVEPFTYQWSRDGVDIADATASTLSLPSVQLFHAGSYSVRVNSEAGEELMGPVSLTVTAAPLSDSRLLNLSTRASPIALQSMIHGFVVDGVGTKRLLIRATGSELQEFGVVGAFDPDLVLKRVMGGFFVDVATNDNWGDNPSPHDIVVASQIVGAFPLTARSRQAALLGDLPAGQYSAVADVLSPTGICLVELYDVESDVEAARLLNLSTRGYSGPGAQRMIAGFVISDEGAKTLLIRAVGPQLAEFSVAAVLADPRMTLYGARDNGSGDEIILINDNWGENGDAAIIGATAAQVGAFELDAGSSDCAVVVTLLPGVYTVHAVGANATGTGVVLVEVYVVE